MASLIRRQEYPVNVDYNGWALQDFDDTQVPVLFPEDFDSGTFLTAHPGRLDFYSAGHTHTASLTVEIWDGEPAAPAGEWDETALASIVCSSGKLRARGMAAGPMPEVIELSDNPSVWMVRVVCTGREAAAAQTQHGVVHGVERYIAQFWPSA
ncbi:hypothetical protein [Streptomyces purpurascens]|uniref:hypothetical protein n=1 Tax=Streptomyces purpurascens TaxID=1924 RepID=UPI001675246E|nr:hypothetical protein [Streptomyces purpurascens]MCE7047061.1 hypothetical protein [Streptomyces purpurascens]GHA03584.1 hypothetical protein GCM10010303_11380 [Streptomyces purpurascens]